MAKIKKKKTIKRQKENILFFFIMLPILALTIFTLSQSQILRQFAAEKDALEVNRVVAQGCDMAGNNQCVGTGPCVPYGAGRAGYCAGGAPGPAAPANPVINLAPAAKAPVPTKAPARKITSGPVNMPTPTPKYIQTPLTRENSPFKNAFKVSCAKDIMLVIGGFCTPTGVPTGAPTAAPTAGIMPPNYKSPTSIPTTFPTAAVTSAQPTP